MPALKGANVHTAKLNDKKVRRIRKLWNNPNRKVTVSSLAREYGVSPGTMSLVVSNQSWRHVK